MSHLYFEIAISGVFLFVSLLAYMHPLEKREHYRENIGFLSLGYVSLWSVFFLVFRFVPWVQYICALVLLLYAILFVYSCVKVNIVVAIYVAIWSIITIQFLYQIWRLMNSYVIPNDNSIVSSPLFFAICCSLIYFVLWKTITERMPRDGRYDIGPRQFTSAIVLLLLFELLHVRILMSSPEHQVDELLLPGVLSQAYGIFTLYIQTELFKKSAIEHDLDTLNLLRQQQKSQYTLNKENIDIINRKCHDLKHQISAVRSMADTKQIDQYLDDMESSALIYDAIVKTGNEVLDTILTQKSLFCEANGIHIHSVVDGNQLDFIEPVDLYTILGNAIDNAIEGVKKVKNRDLRLIDIAIYTKAKFLVMTISNPIDDQITFEGEVPISTKPNNGYHGYGIKSIKHYIKKYNGNVNISVENNCFVIKMLIPIT